MNRPYEIPIIKPVQPFNAADLTSTVGFETVRSCQPTPYLLRWKEYVWFKEEDAKRHSLWRTTVPLFLDGCETLGASVVQVDADNQGANWGTAEAILHCHSFEQADQLKRCWVELNSTNGGHAYNLFSIERMRRAFWPMNSYVVSWSEESVACWDHTVEGGIRSYQQTLNDINAADCRLVKVSETPNTLTRWDLEQNFSEKELVLAQGSFLKCFTAERRALRGSPCLARVTPHSEVRVT